jgi:chromosome segregation ATPase
MERFRLQRIDRARSNGRLLVYSPSNKSLSQPSGSASLFCLNLSPSQPAPRQEEEKDAIGKAVDKQQEASGPNDDLTRQQQQQQMEMLQKLHENVNKLLSEQTNMSRRDSLDTAADESTQMLLEKFQAILSAASQQENHSNSNDHHMSLLQETNAKLVQDLQHLSQQLLEAKATSAALNTKLQLQEATTQTQFNEIQSRQANLRAENEKLESEKLTLQETVSLLERELETARSQLEQWEARLDDVTSQRETQIQDWEITQQQLESTNRSLQNQLEHLESENSELAEENQKFEQSIQIYETQTVPEIQAQLNHAKDRLAQVEASITTKELELAESQATVQFLQNSLQDIRDQLEREHTELQTVQEQLERLQEERNSIVETQKQERVKLIREQSQLNSALEESMQQLEVIETEKRQLEKRLMKITQKLDIIQSNNSETSKSVSKLSEQLTEEIQRRQEFQEQNEILRRQLHETRSERDLVKSSMESFNERENKLYKRVLEGDRIRRQMHSKLLTLMGNIRVFVRVRLPCCESHTVYNNDNSDACQKKRKREPDDNDTTPFRFPELYGSLQENQQPQMQPGIFSSGKSGGDDLTKNWLEIQEPFKDRGGLQNRQRTWRFGFDGVFQPHHTNNDVWESAEPLIQCAVDGSNVTVVAYGQTGSGTYKPCVDSKSPLKSIVNC